MGLSPRTRKLLDAYREQESLSADEVESSWSDVSRRLASGDVPSLDVELPSVKVPWVHVLWSKLPFLVPCLIGVGGVAVLWFAADARNEPGEPRGSGAPPALEVALPSGASPSSAVSPPNSLVQVEELPPEGPSRAGHDLPEAITQPLRKVTSGSGRSSRDPMRRSPTMISAPSDRTSLASAAPGIEAELALLKDAHEFLRAKRPRDALRVLAEHRERFPNGKLADSREYAQVLALCQTGQAEAARTRATQFQAQFPGSPFLARVKAACPFP